jgi:uncharacterized protein (DUF2235 family)
MPLYAFDGTWNSDEIEDDKDTNVCKFFHASLEQESQKFYQKGVGTKWGFVGKAIGGITGAGGWARVLAAKRHLEENWSGQPVDVIGFSRGSALALDFVNEIAGGIEPKAGPAKGTRVEPVLRFLGLWDLVASFGIPGNRINLGYQLTVPAKLQFCYHALSLDEMRYTFGLTRVKYVDDKTSTNGGKRAYEVWFRGGHSDVGGGNQNSARSDIALRWMMIKATSHGVPLDAARIPAPLGAGADPPVKGKKWLFKWSRKPDPNERVHHTVAFGNGFNDPPQPVVLEHDGSMI